MQSRGATKGDGSYLKRVAMGLKWRDSADAFSDCGSSVATICNARGSTVDFTKLPGGSISMRESALQSCLCALEQSKA